MVMCAVHWSTLIPGLQWLKPVKKKKANKLLLENERGKKTKKKDEKNCLTCVGSSKPN